ncbi:cupredoxin domain-containing protein [Geodermatophilus maliterrae]|uniref:Cupredoxin domain-containing protein n=1 Tax=Geodermatophilus maliterrae TaxID=3162531 RepID=A0ABV3XL40_9ACTN
MRTTLDQDPLLSRGRRCGAVLVIAATLGALTACSGGSDAPDAAAPSSTGTSSSTGGPATPAPETPASSSLPAGLVDFAIEMPETELEAGTYRIDVANDGRASHDLVVEDAGGSEVAATEILTPGGSGTLEVTLEPGEYAFYCSVGNHRGMGMELVVTVV